jgi:hypothetical protein
MCGKSSARIIGAVRGADDRPPTVLGAGSPTGEVMVQDFELEDRELWLVTGCGFGFDEISVRPEAASSIQLVGGT